VSAPSLDLAAPTSNDPAAKERRDVYDRAVAAAVATLASSDPTSKIRLAKKTSNLFRSRTPHTGVWLDASPFRQVLSVDVENRTASVGGMTTYEDLVDATLPYGLMPEVVPQLATITLGGAVTGLGIEASSFRAGLPHESVLDLDILTGAGEVVHATPDNEHAELFATFPNSYGTVGYALRLTISLAPVTPYVKVRHVRCPSADALTEALAVACETREWDGEKVDFVDGVWFREDESYMTVGRFVENAPYTNDYTGQKIFYRSLQSRREDYLTTRDYLWRWDTDWFWCSRAFGAQNKWARKVWPARYRRSSFYWRIIALERRFSITARLDQRAGRPERENVVQDIEIPVGRLPEMLRRLDEITHIEPVWVCPVRLAGDRTWPLYPMKPHVLYVNVGFWSSTALSLGEKQGAVNRRVEELTDSLDGHKSLYSTAFYSEDDFWQRYPADAYWPVKRKYDPAGRLLDLYTKCVGGG
jgi:FAD/FMN-containing dehydrogenase